MVNGGAGAFKILKPWSVTNVLNKIGVGKFITKKIEEGVEKCGGIGFMTMPDTSASSYLKGGQILERVWLQLTECGISFQPMTTVNFFDMRMKENGESGFEERHRPIVKKGLQEFYDMFPEVDRSKCGHVMLFRFGYSKDIPSWTIRKHLSSVLLKPIKAFCKKKELAESF